jgi:hypothetical protein
MPLQGASLGNNVIERRDIAEDHPGYGDVVAPKDIDHRCSA